MSKTDGDIGAAKSVAAVTLDDSPGLLVQTGDTLLYGIHIINTVAAISYLQLFNKAALSDVTLGTTVPDISLPLPVSGILDADFTKPIKFDKGLCAFSTTTAGGAGAAITHGTIIYA